MITAFRGPETKLDVAVCTGRVEAATSEENGVASDLAAHLMRKSVGSLASARSRCSGCRRVPLAGESLHVLPSERVVCDLCLVRLPESERDAARCERVHATDRPLAVVRRAA